MKEHTMSSIPDEFTGNSTAQTDSFRHAKPASSPLAGKTGISLNWFPFGARRIQARASLRSARALLVILMVAAVSIVGTVPPALCQMDEDLREAVESHNAGRTKEAIDIYTEVLEKNPRSAEALNWRGMAYDDLGKLDEALADLNKAIQLSPNYVDAYNNRGEVHRKKKMYPQAKADYGKAISLDRAFAEPHYNMALVLEQEKNNREAVKELNQYLKLQPNAEDKREIEDKIKSLTAPPKVEKPAGAPEAKKPAPSAAAKPGERPVPKPGERPGARPGAKAWKAPEPAKQPPATGGIPGMEQVPIPKEAMAALAALGVFAAILPLIVYIFFAVMLFLIARKTATSLPWLAFIPIANVFLMIMIAGKPIWWLALVLLPVLSPAFGMLASVDPTGGILSLALTGIVALVSIVAWLFICIGIAQARGKSAIWGVLLFLPCTNFIALGYLGLSK